ncbi:MAG: cellulase family glycosylhydrolase [Candidatus Daviesbacteria bacterium]|nr:cellulase family glycosylhydrolase [Candidatus Daviesbacteria bacterium]
MKKLLTFLIVLSIIAIISILVSFLNIGSGRIKYGVSFSPKYAGYLGLDWQQTYTQILDELKIKNLRIPGYWDALELEEGKYDFSETDFMLSEANKRGVKVILVVGIRQPRWPECHVPAWARSLSVKERQKKVLQFIRQTVSRYKEDSSVWAWQVENEPLMGSFGEGCDKPDKRFLKSEVELVKSLSSKKIILTDSGELGSWISSMQLSDIFGTTVYRQVHNKYLGYIVYPYPPYFYSFKSSLIKNIFARHQEKTIIAELQAEPWLADGNLLPPNEQAKLFTKKDFKSYIDFAEKAGFDEAYLWGVEWWYFMASKGYPEYLEYAKELFR